LPWFPDAFRKSAAVIVVIDLITGLVSGYKEPVSNNDGSLSLFLTKAVVKTKTHYIR